MLKDNGKRFRVFRTGFWILVSVATTTFLWYYSKFWWQNYVHIENELCNRWLSIDRTIKKCYGKPLSWRSRIKNITSVTSADKKSRFRDFKPTLTAETFTELIELLEVFVSTCEDSSILWIMFGGSLLGALRHFGMIPWDADIDVLEDIKDQGRLKHELSTLNDPSYMLYEYGEFQWKFYKMSTRLTHDDNGVNPFPPFVDIFFYDYERNNSIVRLQNSLFHHFFYNISDMFPIKLRPFEDFLLPTPNNAIRVLDLDYGKSWNSTCTSVSSMNPSYGKMCELDCKELYDFYPFVFRTKFASREKFTLIFRGEPIFHLTKVLDLPYIKI